jgi:hypothetical protein
MEAEEPHTTRYQYAPLREALPFRILTLYPAPSFISPLRCDLQASLLVPGLLTNDYEALSYTWGDPHSTSVVLLPDNTTIPITANLESFLRHRREQRSSVHLWVDALCINQDDIPERNSQVERMGNIYATTARLTVWLGPAHSDSDMAIKLLRTIARNNPFHRLESLNPRELTAIENLLSRAWWSRIWIVQELRYGVYGKRLDKGQVMCGQAQIPWTSLVVACARLDMSKGRCSRSLGGSNVANVLELDALAQPDPEPERNYRFTFKDDGMMKILNTVVKFRSFQATDPKDKLYAMTSMLTPCISHQVDIPITYALSKEAVYTHFAITILRVTEDLDFLRHIRRATHDNMEASQLPSWAPDWVVPITEKPLPSRRNHERLVVPWWSLPSVYGTSKRTHYFRCRDLEAMRQYAKDILDKNKSSMTSALPTSFMNVESSESTEDVDDRHLHNAGQVQQRYLQQFFEKETSSGPQYTAGGNQKSGFVIKEPANHLRVNGILWDEIDVLHKPFIYNLGVDETNFTRLTDAISACKNMVIGNHKASSPYGSERMKLRALWTTIFAGQTTDNLVEVTDWLPDAHCTWECSTPSLTALDADRLQLKTAELGQYALGRRFFITRNGYFGLGPQAAREGDHVIILPGVDVPFVLRKSSTTHRVVGEAYVEGIMRGEALEQWRLGTKEIRKFVLS